VYGEKRYKAALSALRSPIRLKPDGGFYRPQGRAFVALGREDRAAESFERAATTATPR
jgi:uncharacterized protein HemY